MLRAAAAGIAVAALLCGFAAAPYTHVHHAIESVADEHHPRGATLVHTHATPHAHHEAEGENPVHPDGDGDEKIWSIASFVFQQSAPRHPSAPALIIGGMTEVEGTSTRLGTPGPEPSAHSPPVVSLAAWRAPPVDPPAFA